jgi:hypothetical protein
MFHPTIVSDHEAASALSKMQPETIVDPEDQQKMNRMLESGDNQIVAISAVLQELRATTKQFAAVYDALTFIQRS